jgi:hypothetical protein
LQLTIDKIVKANKAIFFVNFIGFIFKNEV